MSKHPSAWIKALTAFMLFTLLIIACNSVTPIPSATPTSADNPTAGAIARDTQIAKATQAAESTADAQATLDESATQAADRATRPAHDDVPAHPRAQRETFLDRGCHGSLVQVWGDHDMPG